MNMNEAAQVRFKTELIERLMTVRQPDGIHLKETAIFAVANKSIIKRS
jgi:hypothetical protein